jgi:hypothetical protein
MESSGCYVGVDVGTQGVRAGVVGQRTGRVGGPVLGRAERPLPLHRPAAHPHLYEQSSTGSSPPTKPATAAVLMSHARGLHRTQRCGTPCAERCVVRCRTQVWPPAKCGGSPSMPPARCSVLLSPPPPPLVHASEWSVVLTRPLCAPTPRLLGEDAGLWWMQRVDR